MSTSDATEHASMFMMVPNSRPGGQREAIAQVARTRTANS
jgi:hypothetical protein